MAGWWLHLWRVGSLSEDDTAWKNEMLNYKTYIECQGRRLCSSEAMSARQYLLPGSALSMK